MDGILVFAIWIWNNPFEKMGAFFKKTRKTPEEWLREGCLTSDDDAAIIFFDRDEQLGRFDNDGRSDGYKLFNDGRLAVWCVMRVTEGPEISISESDGMDMPDHLIMIPASEEDTVPDLSFLEVK